VPKNIVQTLRGANLDATVHKKVGDKLKEQILEDVKGSQIFVGRHLPDKLFITKAQFDSIEEDLQRMQETEDRIYVTSFNVMEVYVVDA
jgi:hypothetical protein